MGGIIPFPIMAVDGCADVAEVVEGLEGGGHLVGVFWMDGWWLFRSGNLALGYWVSISKYLHSGRRAPIFDDYNQ